MIYRERSHGEGDGYLVTALVDREAYEAYKKAEQEGLTSTPLWKMVTTSAAGTLTGTGTLGATGRADDNSDRRH